MRIAVMGAGGTGAYFGGLLARAGEDVMFIARGAHLDAIRAEGLRVKSRLVGEFTLPVKATDDPGEIGPVELILFCVKAYDTDAAAERIRGLIGPDTMILSVQNGIDNEERISKMVDRTHVLGGLAQVVSVIEAPGVIAQTAGFGKIIFGELSGDRTPRTERLLTMFQRAGIAAELRTDILVALWEKFLFICGYSGVTALTRLPIGPILACPDTRALLRGTMEEAEAIGRACNIGLPVGCADGALNLLSGLEPAARSSLYYDLAAGRRLEVEALNGAIVRLGRERGIATPLNFAIYAALKPYENGAPALP